MGTRADFYVGRGEEAEWLGSTAWDGYPEGISRELLGATTESGFRHYVARFFADRDDVTLPEMGWPWPWDNSGTTDFAYAFDDGNVWASCFGSPWVSFPRLIDHGEEDEPWEDEGPGAVFPDMSARKNVTIGSKRSGVMLISAPRRDE